MFLNKILFIAILVNYIIYSLTLFMWCGGYYTYKDLFGPLSKNFTVTLSLISFLILSLTYLLVVKGSKGSKITSLSVFILMVSSIYVLPDIADSYYDQNFYDAGGHMIRGAFVTLTGHSDPDIDAYFDLQPGFFWFTAMFINIVYGLPKTLEDPIFSFLVKWFHIIAVAFYIPIIYMLFQKYELRDRGILLALFLFYVLNLGRFHYAAQTYANALFWLLLTLLPDIIMSRDSKKLFTALPILTTTVFVHNGVTVFTIITLLSTSMSMLFSKQLKKAFLPVSALLVYLLLSWFIYLLYVSKFILSNFISTFIDIVNRYLGEGPIEITLTGLWRAWQPWAIIVRFKVAYMATIILAVTVLTMWIYRITKNEIYVLRTFIILGISVFIGAVAVALGGAGYIERVYLLLLPLISLTLTETINNSKQRTILKKLALMLMICYVIIAPFAFFSGRNFQSIPTSDGKAGLFLRTYTESIVRLYLKVKATSALTPLSTNQTLIQDTIYWLRQHDFIQTLYYVVGDIIVLNNYVYKLKLACSIIHSNPTTQIFQC